ncbi:hypothetical protein [Streptomyces luteogriseus]|uniref:hypothetical protein n=1 Tax=Streptomyces luteogriseus TaxID=68233 RepID=UPI002E377820|nr:hypothetical protein [Streptomyces luteogriseus]WTJ29030.1 hypothetical protein OID52_19165 [Streptomyces luteogriseus]
MSADFESAQPEAGRRLREARLLPWSSPEGKSSYLITDDRGGRLSRLADTAEATQLDMGAQLLAHAEDMLPDATETQLRFLAERLTEALRDILRVVESRERRTHGCARHTCRR